MFSTREDLDKHYFSVHSKGKRVKQIMMVGKYEDKIHDTEALDISPWLLSERKCVETVVDEEKDNKMYLKNYDMIKIFNHFS